jgi:Protein of unknown function
MVYASPGTHSDLLEDANKPVVADVQAAVRSLDADSDVGAAISQDLVVVESPKPPRKVSIVKARRLARLHETAAVGLALGALFAGYIAWRLSEGTVSIVVATPYVEDSLERIVGGTAKIGSLRLGWDKDRRDFVVMATQIKVTTDARTSPLTLGEVNLTLNAQALLLGRTQITRADIAGLQAVLVIDKQGRTAFGFGTPEEVLALPRQKRETKSVRSILDSVRTAVLPDTEKGRVEAIALTGAQLVVVDPDTGERLTLGNARASVTTDANNIVTMQAAGFAREMGGFANVAVSSSPDLSQRLVLASVFDHAQLSKLPTSLRVGPLSRLSGDTAPLSGNVLVHLGEQSRAFDVRANITLGAGRFQGLDIQDASGSFVLNGTSGNLVFTNIAARGPLVTLAQGNGRLGGVQNGLRPLAFEAKTFAYRHSSIGSVSGDTVRGNAQIRGDNLPASGSVLARRISFARDKLADITASGLSLVLSTPNARQPNQLNARLTTQGLSGTVQGRGITGSKIDTTFIGNRQDGHLTLSSASAKAAQFAASLNLRNVTQRFDISNLNVIADRFKKSSFAPYDIPNNIALSASDVRIGGDSISHVSGRISGLSLDATNLWAGNATTTGAIANFTGTGKPISGQTISTSGRSLVFDIGQTSASIAQVSRLQAQNLSLAANQLSVGTVDFRASGTLERGRFANAQIAASSVEIAQPEQLLRPFWAEDLRVRGTIAPRAFDLEAFAFRHRGVELIGSTSIALAPRGSPRVDLTADVNGSFSVETLLSAWPRRFLKETRGSIQRLVPAGIASVSKLNLAIPAGMLPKQILPKSGIDLEFALSDVAVTYLPGMSAITGVRGQGKLTGDSLSLDLPAGTIGNIALSDGKVEIPQFMPRGAHALISAKVAGDVSDIAQEIDLPPLAILSKANLDPARLSGEGTASLNLDIPLKPALIAGDIGVSVRGDFTNAGLTRTFAGIDATNGAVRLEVVNNKTIITGKATLASNLFDFSWISNAQVGAPAQTQLTANGDVSIASLREIGFDLDAYAQGPVRINVTSNTEGSQFGAAIINGDFINTNISLPGELWKKPEGTLAQASANVYPREGGGWNVQDLRFDSGPTFLRGAVDLTESGQLLDARFSRVVIPNAGDLSVNITPAASGIIVTLRGEYLNLSPFLKTKNVSEQAVQLFDRPLVLSADIKRVSTAEDSTLNNVHAEILRDLKGWRNLLVTGESLAGKSQIRLMVERDGRRSVSGIVSDAGFFAQSLYPGAPIFGGTGTIEGELPVVGANSSGILTFTGKDIRFVRPNMSPILFQNVQMPMSVRGGVVTLRGGQADGDAYTVKANGYVDVGAGKLDIRGVATPGGLNRVLADIPLFGGILGGGTDEGLVGMTFTAKGSLSAPRLITNPISALAPGFLRKLFESNIPLSPQPRLVVTNLAGDPIITKWPYGPTEDMSEASHASQVEPKVGPAQ